MAHGQCFGIKLDDLVLVFYVGKNAALAVGGWCFHVAAQLGGAHNFAGRPVEHSATAAGVAEEKHPLREGVVEQRVGLGASGHGGDGFQRFQVEHHALGGAPASDIAAVGARCHIDAVYAGRIGDGADDLAGFQVHNLDLCVVRDVEVLAGGVDVEVVPAAFAADGNSTKKVVGCGLGGRLGLDGTAGEGQAQGKGEQQGFH